MVKKKEICEYCKRQYANSWRNGKYICTICWILCKHNTVPRIKNMLNKHNLWDEFVDLYPNVVLGTTFGKVIINKVYFKEVIVFHREKYDDK